MKDMASVVQELIAQQTHIFELLGDDRIPTPRPPITADALAHLQTWWAKQGASLPASYVAFLKVCDGIESFCSSYDLFGAQDLLSPAYGKLSEALVPADLGLPKGDEAALVLLGWSDETDTRLIADLRHAPLQAGEAVILEGDAGNWSLHESFGDYLRMRVEANRLTMAEILRVRQLGEDA